MRRMSNGDVGIDLEHVLFMQAHVALEESARVRVWEMLLGMSGSRVSGGAEQEME